MARLFIFAAIGVGVLLFVRAILGAVRPPTFRATVHGNDVEITGVVPSMSNREAADFLNELRLPVGSRVDGFADGGRVRLEFSSDFPQDERQRVRNFLMNPRARI